MPDREKVIKGLAHCTRPTEYGKGGNRCMDCPYTEAIGFNQFKCNGQQMMKDAIALLKEQEERINKMLHQPRTVICCYRCKWNSGTQDKPYCQKYSMARLPEWFCADGERKEGR